MYEGGGAFRNSLARQIYLRAHVAEGDEIKRLKEELEVAKKRIFDYQSYIRCDWNRRSNEQIEPPILNHCRFCCHELDKSTEQNTPCCSYCMRPLPCKQWCIDVIKTYQWTLFENDFYCPYCLRLKKIYDE
jgi:hypothetical protein